VDRYAVTFKKLKRERRSAFIPFTVIGDPDYKTSLKIVKTFVACGADILELGLPFSDPIADGPVNQRAGQRALQQGMNTPNLFKFVQSVRHFTEIPIGLLCYYNSVLSYGIDRFYARARKCGIDSILVADASLEESNALVRAARRSGIKTVFIISELSDPERIKKIAQRTTAFIYLVSRLGVTGIQKRLNKSIRATINTIKKFTSLPVCVGFGISAPAHVRSLARLHVEGIICGSAIVRRIERHLGNPKRMQKVIASFIRSMKGALQ
jgi:tryptophan synthase alpha chain